MATIQNILNVNPNTAYEMILKAQNVDEIKPFTVSFTIDEYNDCTWYEMYETEQQATEAADAFAVAHDDNYYAVNVYDTHIVRYNAFGKIDTNVYHICDEFDDDATFKMAIVNGELFVAGDVWNIKTNIIKNDKINVIDYIDYDEYITYLYDAAEYYRECEPWNMYQLLTLDEFLS